MKRTSVHFLLHFRSALGVLIALFVSVSGMTFLPASEAEEIRVLDRGPVMQIDIHGAITPATDDYLKTSLNQAQSEGARLLVITLNTPGGVLTSTQSMTEHLLSSPVPTVVFVSPSGGSATSAGVFVTMAANFAVMAPGTTIGAAHPVSGGGQNVEGDMRAKIENFASSLIKAIAEQRGRNVSWAEKAVRESVSITDREAVDLKVVDLSASDVPELLNKLEERMAIVGGKPVKLVGVSSEVPKRVPMSFKQRVVQFLSDPNIAMIIGLLAMLGLGVEMYNPGLIIPGLIGVICLVLALVAAQAVPIDGGGAALLGLGVVFFLVELFLPSFGVWGIAGTVCLVLGAIYLVDAEAVWSVSGFQVDVFSVSSVALGVGGLLTGASVLAVMSRTKRIEVGRESLLDVVGVLKEELSPGGTARVFLRGEYWRALPASGVVKALPSGTQVRVVESKEDLSVVVEAFVPESASADPES